jgi:hypothetical protein
MNQAIAAYSARLPPRGVAELFASGIPSITGALHPPAKAVRTDDGWRITGQVPFASGCHHAQWLVMPAQEREPISPSASFSARGRDASRYMAHFGDARNRIDRYRVTASLCRSTAPRAGGSAAVDREENAAKPRTDEV